MKRTYYIKSHFIISHENHTWADSGEVYVEGDYLIDCLKKIQKHVYEKNEKLGRFNSVDNLIEVNIEPTIFEVKLLSSSVALLPNDSEASK